MLLRSNCLRTPIVSMRALFGWAGALLLATTLAQYWVVAPAWRVDSPVQYNTDLVVFAGLLWAGLQVLLHPFDARERRRWLWAVAAMLLLVGVQATDFLVEFGIVDDDWFVDLPLWFAVAYILRRVLQRGREHPWIARLRVGGLVLQTVFVCCDLAAGQNLSIGNLPADGFATIAEWTEMLAIECYVVALVVFGAVAVPRRDASRVPLALGAEARRLFRDARLFRRAVYPPVRAAFLPGVRQAFVAVVCAGLVMRIGPIARRACGRSLGAQACDLVRLCIVGGFDPLAYYLQELYRPGSRKDAALYLTRYETKNGLFNVLNGLRTKGPKRPHEMKDKRVFAARCERLGLPSPRTLMSCDALGARWLAPRVEFDRDLFSKPARGRGARGTLTFERTGRERFRPVCGDALTLDDVVERLRTIGRRVPLVVQPRLSNHAELAGLADRSLIAIRVLSCLDRHGRPVVTHGVLRILSKLEPDWICDDEFGAPIDVETGRLGCLVSDRLAFCDLRHARHPVTDAAVEGRRLATWPAVRALALDAHRAFAERVLVGWDVASTPDGPVLLEGNTNPDVMFPQRVYREGFGSSALAPLLQFHLASIAREHGLD